MRRRSGGWMRCGVSLASSSEVRREGQTFAGESLLVRYANFVKLPHTIFALPFALLGVVVASYRAAVTGRTLGLAVLAFTCARFVALGFNRIADRALARARAAVGPADPGASVGRRGARRGAVSVGGVGAESPVLRARARRPRFHLRLQ